MANLNDYVRFNFYGLDPSTHLQRFIKVLSRCSTPTSKELIWDPCYMLPLDYRRNRRMLAETFLFGGAYHFIYSIEENPGFRHLLYLFQGESIHNLERVVSQHQGVQGIGNDEENDERSHQAPHCQ